MSKAARTLAIILLCAYQLPAREPIRTLEGIVTRVSDGDTLHAEDRDGTKLKIRLYGIDAPETAKTNRQTGKTARPGQPWGFESWKALERKVLRLKVRIDVMDRDKYRRLVCIIWLNGRNINREMVSEGHAWAYKKYLGNSPFASDFIKCEEQARAERLGLWKDAAPEPPWKFRKSMDGEQKSDEP